MSTRCEEVDTYLASFINVGNRATIPRLNGDKDALKLILVNILKNAAQHTLRGSIKVVVYYDQGQEVLHVAVMDTGSGMTVE